MTQFQLKKRREQIAKYLIRQFSVPEIAKMLDMPIQTVYNDIKIIKVENEEYIKENKKIVHDVAENIIRMLMKYKEMEAECWKRYQSAEEGSRRGYLNTLRGIYQDVSKLLKLIDIKNINIEQMVNIENFTPILNKISIIIDKYVPEKDRLKAIEDLRNIELPE